MYAKKTPPINKEFIICKSKVKEAIKDLDVTHYEEVLQGIQ